MKISSSSVNLQHAADATAPVRTPFMAAEIFVKANRPSPDWRAGHARKNQCDMARPRDHGIGLVGFTLTRATSMDVRVRDHGEPEVFANLPKAAERIGVQNADTAFIGGGVEFIVINGSQGAPLSGDILSQQERAGFVPACEIASNNDPSAVVVYPPDIVQRYRNRVGSLVARSLTPPDIQNHHCNQRHTLGCWGGIVGRDFTQ